VFSKSLKKQTQISPQSSLFLLYIQLILFLSMFPTHPAIFLCSAEEQSQVVGLLSNLLAQLTLSLFRTDDGWTALVIPPLLI
jgi:hypothetical protein